MRWACVAFAVIGWILPANAADPRSALPKVAPGWSIEVVAEAPRIVFPTAVVAAPDGTVYLGQDPMDMPGPPTKPIDSVVAIKDGRVRVFADHLWSVMGLEWIDDTLYVVHAPFLSAFTDTDGDGKADRRVDLITGLGPEVPGFSGINDHVASGIRLGMDGFLYISFGDKGIPRGVGKDGATIRVEGGGVLRIRPDGTGLEVVSTGERNPLSVALSATDEVFSYGNDDDSKKWPNSLTHHVVGGHYGYPYQFQTEPRKCLPIVAGQLGGSGTQGVCYNEDGLPADYRGDFFFCDWGLQEVFRYKLEKAGGTYKLVSKTSFVSAGKVADFRPFSITVAPDGASFYLVDWAFTGWLTQGVQTGRLYKMTYAGTDRPKATPRPARGDPASLVAALDHPAFSIRLGAQRNLAKQKAVKPLIERFERTQPAGQSGRTHALWALDAVVSPGDQTAIARTLRAGLSDAEPSVRLQSARRAGIRRDREAAPALAKLLRDSDPAVRREAAIALGKIGGPEASSWLMAALGDADRTAEWSIEHALRRLKDWDTATLTEALLDPKRRSAALDLTEDAYAVAVVDALIEALPKAGEPAIRARIASNLAGLHRRLPEWSGHWFGTNPLAGDLPTKTRPWSTEGMTRVVVGLTQALSDEDASVRKAAIAGLADAGPAAVLAFRARLDKETDPANQAMMAATLGRFHDAESVPILARWLGGSSTPYEVRRGCLDALAQMPGRPAVLARLSILYDKNAPPELLARALPSLGLARIVPANDLMAYLDHASPVVRVAAIAAIVGRPPLTSEAKQAVIDRLKDPSPDVRKAAIEALGSARVVDAVPALIPMARADATRSEAVAALCNMPDPRALSVYLAAISDRNPDVRRSGERALLAIRDLVEGDLAARFRPGAIDEIAAEAVARVLTRFAPIVTWKVIGPFPRTTPRLFQGEPSIDFAKGHAGIEGKVVPWVDRMAEPATGRVVLDDFKSGAGDKGGFGYDTNGSPDLAAFAYAEIPSESDRPALLLIGSSGSLIVSLNEQVILNYSDFAGRPFAFDSDRVRVSLKKGRNRLLVRTRQGIGSWSFGVQISEPSQTLMSPKAGVASLAQLRDFAQTHVGDPARGRALFFDAKGIGCVKCHAIGTSESAAIGPDLTGLALKYDRAEIIRSVLEPSNRIATGFQPVIVATTDGKVTSGLVRSEDADHLDLIEADAKLTRIVKSAIEERRLGEVSLMPTGLVDVLSTKDFADLIAFLMTLKTSPPPR